MLFAQNTNIEGNISYFGFDDLDDTYYPKIKIALLDKDYLGYKVNFSLVQHQIKIKNLPDVDTLFLEFSCDGCYTLRKEFVAGSLGLQEDEKIINGNLIHIVNESLKIVENSNYLVYYSEKSQQPVYLKYRLPKGEKIDKPKKNFRDQSIFLVKNKTYYDRVSHLEDTAVIDKIKTSDYDDYENNDYDRSHLASVRAFSNEPNDYYINSYLNCVLMNKTLNKGVWNLIEAEEVRLNQEKDKDVFVEIYITFSQDTVEGGALIPETFGKSIYVYDNWISKEEKVARGQAPELTKHTYLVFNNDSEKGKTPQELDFYVKEGRLMYYWEYIINQSYFREPIEYYKDKTTSSYWESTISRHRKESLKNMMQYE